MLKSVYINGGFYIGRYEAGITTYRTSDSDTIADDLQPLSQANQYPLNYVTCSQAEMLAERIAPIGYNSSLMFGVQWNLILKYLETKGTTPTTLNSDSSEWKNYKNTTFNISNNNASYSIDSGSTYTLVGDYIYVKPEYEKVLLTTGANGERNSKMNICDLAGNVAEWTLEFSSGAFGVCNRRGASYKEQNLSAFSTDVIGYMNSGTSTNYNGFRGTLY